MAFSLKDAQKWMNTYVNTKGRDGAIKQMNDDIAYFTKTKALTDQKVFQQALDEFLDKPIEPQDWNAQLVDLLSPTTPIYVKE